MLYDRKTHRTRLLRTVLIVLLVGLVSSACSLSVGTSTDATLAPDTQGGDGTTTDSDGAIDSGAPPIVTLLSPRDGQTYLQGTTVNIIARIENAGPSLDRIQVLLNGSPIADQQISTAADANTFVATQEWPSTSPGQYTIEVVTFRQDGARNAPASASITVRSAEDGQLPAPTQAASDTPTATPTNTPDQQSAEASATPTATSTKSADITTQAPQVQPSSTPTQPPSQAPQVKPSATPSATPTLTATQQLFALVTDTAGPLAPTASFPQGRLQTAADIRSAPSTNAGIVGSVLAGQTVRLQAVTSDGAWYRVPVGFGSVGWISASVLETSNADDLPVVDG